MANVNIQLSLESYGALMTLLDEARLECENEDNVIAKAMAEIQQNSFLDEADKVRIRFSNENLNIILRFILPIGGDKGSSDYEVKLLENRENRRKEMAAAEQAKAEYEKWLIEVVSKYVSDTSLSCKEICDKINQNDLKPGMEKLKYQSIMRTVKACRSK